MGFEEIDARVDCFPLEASCPKGEAMTIEQRVEKLERQNRVYKRAGLTVFVLATVIVSMGARRWCSTMCTVRANRFVLTDSCGNERGELTLFNNEPLLRLYGSGADENKRPLVSLGISSANHRPAYLSLLSENRKTRVSLQAREQHANASVWGIGDPIQYSEIIAGPDSAPGLRVTFDGQTRVHAIAQPNKSEVLVRIGDQTDDLAVP